MIKVAPEELRVLTQFIYSLTGISLDSSKAYLIESRLSDLAETHGCTTFSELFYRAKADSSHAIQRKIIDAITTNETSFFRDASPFELLQYKIFPDLIDRRTKSGLKGLPVSLRIWSAACSTGQEVYSIAIILKELLGDVSGYNIRLVGTDISDQAVAAASRGIYSRLETERGLPPEKLSRYFINSGDTWRVRDDLRALASFRTINLMEDFQFLGRFDIIFCRNVAIYFNDADRATLFSRIARALEPDGYLVIGSTESITGTNPQFESKRYLRSVFYQLKPGV